MRSLSINAADIRSLTILGGGSIPEQSLFRQSGRGLQRRPTGTGYGIYRPAAPPRHWGPPESRAADSEVTPRGSRNLGACRWFHISMSTNGGITPVRLEFCFQAATGSCTRSRQSETTHIVQLNTGHRVHWRRAIVRSAGCEPYGAIWRGAVKGRGLIDRIRAGIGARIEARSHRRPGRWPGGLLGDSAPTLIPITFIAQSPRTPSTGIRLECRRAHVEPLGRLGAQGRGAPILDRRWCPPCVGELPSFDLTEEVAD